MNPRFKDYVGGRIEVYRHGLYADEEIRFFTKRFDEWAAFRTQWDMANATNSELRIVRDTVKARFQEDDWL